MMSRELMGELVSDGLRRVNPNQHLCEKGLPYGKEGLFPVAV